MRVVSVSITFIFFGLGEIGINLISIFMNYYKSYFILQGVAIGLSGITFFFFCESPFYTFKKKTLGDLYSICTYIISKNFEKPRKKKEAIFKVQEILGIKKIMGLQSPLTYSSNNGKNSYFEDNAELNYLSFASSSDKYFNLLQFKK
jgi:hypothetical protein